MAKKNKDITKTGALSYRDLQEQNNFDPATNITIDELHKYMQDNNIFGSQQAVASIYDQNSKVDDYLESSSLLKQKTRTGATDYFGNSIYDSDVIVGEQDWSRLGDVRAENQPWYSKIANGVAKAGVLAVTTAAETAGLILGAGHSLLETAGVLEDNGKSWIQDLWDNPLTNALQKLNDASEEYLPNYYTQDEQENPWSHAFNANWIGDKLLKNFGFMVGAFYGGMPLAKGIGKLGVKAVKRARRLNEARKMGIGNRFNSLTSEYSDDVIKKAAQYEKDIAELSGDDLARVSSEYGDEVVGLHKTLKANGLTESEKGRLMLEGYNKVRNIAQTTRATTQTLGSLSAAINEGAIEALNNSKDWANKAILEENDRHEAKIQELDEMYGDSPEGIDEKIKENALHEGALTEIEKGRAKVGNADLLLNIPILMASNMYQLGKLYTRGFDSNLKSLQKWGNSTRRQIGTIWNGHSLKGSLKDATLKSGRTKKGAIVSALYKSNSEGMEEYLQRAASDGAGESVSEAIRRYISSGKNEDAKIELDNYIAGFGKAIADNLNDPNAWEEYFIGAVSSMVGMPVFGSQTKNAYIGKGKAVGLAGGIPGNYNDYMAARDQEEEIAKYLNKRVKDPKFKALYEHLQAHNDFDILLNDALLAEDKRQYKELEFESLFNDINMAASSGHLEEFKQMIGYNDEYDEKELEEIIKATTRTISPEDQRQQDYALRQYLEQEVARLGALEVLTPEMKEDLDDKVEALKEVNERIENDENGTEPYEEIKDGPFIDANGEMNVTNPEKMIEILQKNKKNVLDTIADYLKIRDEIDIETDGHLKDDNIALLTMMRAKINDFEKRSAEMADDLVNNSSGLLTTYEALKEIKDEKINKTQSLVDTLTKRLKNAEDRKEKKQEIEKIKKEKEEAEATLKIAKEDRKDLDVIVEVLNKLVEEKDSSFSEEYANSRGYGYNIPQSIIDGFRYKERQINSEEVTTILANPRYELALYNAIKSYTSGLDSKQRQKLLQEVVDLSILANQKLQYKKKVKEFLDSDGQEKINEAFQQEEDRLSKEDIENKSSELSLRIQNANNMLELDSIMREAYAINADVATKALDKARETGNEEQKKFIDDYKKGLNFFNDFLSHLNGYSSDVIQGVRGTAIELFEQSLQEASPYDAFISNLKSEAEQLSQSTEQSVHETGITIKEILDNIGAATSTASSKTPKKTSSNSKDTPKSSPSVAEVKKVKDGVIPKGRANVDTLESLSDEITARIKESKDSKDGQYHIDLKALYEDLKDRLEAYNKENPEAQITLESMTNMLTALVDKDISEDGDYVIDDKNDIEIGEEEDGSTRAQEMHNRLRVSFKSDRITEQDNSSRDYKIPYKSRTPQEEAIQKLLKDYFAYRFIDSNYLGYIIKHNRETDNAEGENPTVYFLKSTDAVVDGNGQEESTIFVAIKWDKNAQEAVRKHAFNGKKDINLDDYTRPITIGEDQYHIVGTVTFNRSSYDTEVQQAFAAFQSAINFNTKDKIGLAREAGQPFVLATYQDPVTKEEKPFTSFVDKVYTGRLEKKNNLDDDGPKVSLFEFMTDNQGDPSRNTSSEWANGSEFYFGTIIKGHPSYIDDMGINQDFVDVNSTWVNDHEGAIVMYVPKPDGKLYPVRCTRRFVKDWLNAKADATHTGEELFKALMEDPEHNKNQYLGNILSYLKVLFDEEATIGDRTNARIMLSKYFIFGKQSPIHFNRDQVDIVFKGGNKYTITGDTFEDKANDFLSILAKENIQFTLPSPQIEYISGRDVITSGIMEIGLRGFYNYNANFTIQPIDGNNKYVVVKDDTSGNDEHFTGGSSVIGENREYTIDGVSKVYFVRTDGTATIDGKPVSEEEQSAINLAIKADKGILPTFKNHLVSSIYNEKATKFILDKLKGFDNVFISDGWIVITKDGGQKVEVFKENSKHAQELKLEIEKARIKVTTSNESEIRKLVTSGSVIRQGDAESEVKAGRLKAVLTPLINYHSIFSDLEVKEPSKSREEILNGLSYKLSKIDSSLNDEALDQAILKVFESEGLGKLWSPSVDNSLWSAFNLKRSYITDAIRTDYSKKGKPANESKGAPKTKPKGPVSNGPSTRRFAGKDLATIDARGVSGLMGVLVNNRGTSGKGWAYKVFTSLQAAEEQNRTIDDATIISKINEMNNASDKSSKKKLLDELLHYIDCTM